MKEVTLKIPEDKWEFFKELIKQLDLEMSEEADIPEEHKSIVRERLSSARPEDITLWSEARKKLMKTT
jgi:hypothetical protein